MAMFHDLDSRQTDLVLLEAAQRLVPATVTVSGESGWRNLRSRVLLVQPDRLCLERPVDDAGQGPYEFAPAEKIGVSFKLKHYKHAFTATVAGTGTTTLAGVGDVPSLSVCVPRRMQRLQRRAFNRADVPGNRIVRASIWLGGRDAEPAGGEQDKPVWFGRVVNISAGGLQMATTLDTAEALDIGDTLGVRLTFGTGGEQAVYIDAQYRHFENGEKGVMMGLQFVGLTQTPEGQQALQVITARVAEFQRTEQAQGVRSEE